MCRSFPFPVRNLWKCLSAWALPRCGICSNRPMTKRRVLSLSMRLIPSARREMAAVFSGNDEREQTLNSCWLRWMDLMPERASLSWQLPTVGFSGSGFAASRRFDRRVPVELPDLQGREAILRLHAKDIRISDNVDFNAIARGGFRRQRRGACQYDQ